MRDPSTKFKLTVPLCSIVLKEQCRDCGVCLNYISTSPEIWWKQGLLFCFTLQSESLLQRPAFYYILSDEIHASFVPGNSPQLASKLAHSKCNRDANRFATDSWMKIKVTPQELWNCCLNNMLSRLELLHKMKNEWKFKMPPTTVRDLLYSAMLRTPFLSE